MPATCAICGKTGSFGNVVRTRGEPKKKGGFGLKITGITRRRYRPNLHKVRVTIAGAARRIRVCARCIKSGRVVKRARGARRAALQAALAAPPTAVPTSP